MIRNCFLCATKTDNIFSSTWMLPGLAPTEIGFSICPKCGSVCQSPSVSYDDMMTFYSSIAVYTNPGRQDLPSSTKIRDLDEQIQFIKRGIGHLPKSAMQIGSSDGYTLSQFRQAGVERVMGVEPGSASVALAKRLYNIDSIHGTAESFEINTDFELILLTHVLEHLYEPQVTLEKCRRIQNTPGEKFIYVEVPLMASPASLCPGFFSFEHINYYTKENLIHSLMQASYWPVSVVEHFNSNLSPIVGILASTREQHHYDRMNMDVELNRERLIQYRQKEVIYWQSCLNLINAQLQKSQRIYLWGAGIHTCQLISNTNLLKNYKISGLTDTSPIKWGLKQGDWICENPQSIDWNFGDTVLISSYASEAEIYDSLVWLRDKGVQTLKLHNNNV